MKKCYRCGAVKRLEDFYLHPRARDGRLGKCKDCSRADIKANRMSKRAQYAEYERVRALRPSRKAQALEAQRRRRALHPEKEKARRDVRRALHRGLLIKKPCCHCGKTKTQAHHRDYSKPLDVVWVCFKCHREIEHGQIVLSDYE